jgi:hypothetical protein
VGGADVVEGGSVTAGEELKKEANVFAAGVAVDEAKENDGTAGAGAGTLGAALEGWKLNPVPAVVEAPKPTKAGWKGVSGCVSRGT